jgi:hypothetical protein
VATALLCRRNDGSIGPDTGKELVRRLVGRVLIGELTLECPLEKGMTESSRSEFVPRNGGLAIGCDRKMPVDLINDPPLFA